MNASVRRLNTRLCPSPAVRLSLPLWALPSPLILSLSLILFLFPPHSLSLSFLSHLHSPPDPVLPILSGIILWKGPDPEGSDHLDLNVNSTVFLALGLRIIS